MSEVQLERAAVADAPRTRARDPWLRFACPHCGKRNKIDAVAAGRPAACARCGRPVKIETALATPALPVMRSIDPPKPPPAPEPSPLRQLSAQVAARDQTSRATVEPPRPPRPPLRLPTWAMVAMHVTLTLGTIAAVWALHEYGYLPGFDAPTTHTTVVIVPPAAR